jgi:hypothetical protein
VWGTGNAAEAIGISPMDPNAAKALNFARPGVLYGATDARAPAGSAASPGAATPDQQIQKGPAP